MLGCPAPGTAPCGALAAGAWYVLAERAAMWGAAACWQSEQSISFKGEVTCQLTQGGKPTWVITCTVHWHPVAVCSR